MSSKRPNRFMDSLQIGLAQMLVGSLRGIFRLSEFFVSDERRASLIAFRKKMERMDQDRDAILQQMDKDPRSGMDQMAKFLNCHGDYKEQQDFAVLHAKVQAARTESDALQAIRTQTGSDTEATIDAYKQFIEGHPDSCSAHSYLGGSLAKAKRWEESLEAYRTAERLAGDNLISASMARLNIANVLNEKGDTDVAIAGYRQITEAVPQEHIIAVLGAYLALGEVLNKQGKRQEARAAWEEVIKRDKNKTFSTTAQALLKANP